LHSRGSDYVAEDDWTSIVPFVYRPPLLKLPQNPIFWFFNEMGHYLNKTDLVKQPDEKELLMCDFVRLAVIHDESCGYNKSIMIYKNRNYEGKFKRDSFTKDLWEAYKNPKKDDFISTHRRILKQALKHVQADLANLKPAETGQKSAESHSQEKKERKGKVSEAEFNRFKSFHELFKQLINEHGLPSEKYDQLFEYINDFETRIAPIAQKIGIDLSSHVEAINIIWDQSGFLPDPYDGEGVSFPGDTYGEAAADYAHEQEYKQQMCKEAVADLDRVMVKLYQNFAIEKKSVLELIKQGKSHTLEFKETLEYDVKLEKNNKDVLLSSLKTIAGFLNASGGTLLIGVEDSGIIKGIKRDLSTMRRGNNDRFEQKIRNCLKDRFNPQPLGKVNIEFEEVNEGMICRIDIQASKDVVHLDDKIFVRDGNITQELKGQQITNWIQQRQSQFE